MTLDDSTGRSRTRFLSILFLLAVNAGAAHTLTNQIINRTSAQAPWLIKDEQVSLVDASTLAQTDPISPLEEIDTKHAISVYSVQSGDTIGAIAEKFNVSINTIRWANNLGSKGVIKVGDKLTILPITGIQYTVKKGDTASGIAQKYESETRDILDYNGLDEASDLKVGMEIIIPDGELPASVPAKTAAKVAVKAVTKTPSAKVGTNETDDVAPKSSSAYKLPIPGSVLTQGVHGSNGVDFGAPVGTVVKASMAGEVILAKSSGYNGGYGLYIVVKHANGTQTLYAHLSRVDVAIGENVSIGQTIAKSGNTGRSTGPHLHFEVRGATNPFGKSKVGTHF